MERYSQEKIKFLFDVKNGATPKSSEDDFWDGDVVWITPSDYDSKQCYITDSSRKITEMGLNSCGTNLVPPGSIVVSNRAPIGLIAIADVALCTSQGCKCLVKKKDNINEKFVYYFLTTQGERLNSLGKGTTFFELSSFDLANLKIPVPTMNEQEKIVNYLDNRVPKIDVLINSFEEQKERLEVYRRELIAGIVTKGLDKAAPRKDSGVDWIGEVPRHWSIYPLFAAAKENKQKNTHMTCDNLLSLSYGKIIKKDIKTSFGLLPESFETYQIVDKNATVMRLTDLQNDQRSLRTGFVTERGIITSAYLALNPVEAMNGAYLHYLLYTYDLLKIYYGLGGGLRQSLKFSDIKRLPALIPPLEEQQKIVSFLDAKEKQIDRLLFDVSAQTEKLKEYRKIVIHDAVTGKIKRTEG